MESPCGYICGTLTTSSTLTHESMEHHEPEGSFLCIHSVCVGADSRRKGLARAALRAYAEAVQQASQPLSGMLLICKAHLMGLYASAGFVAQRLSPVVHGKDPWFEMAFDLTGLPYLVIDSFSAAFGGGNPAAVVFRHFDSESTFATVAAEFNLAGEFVWNCYNKHPPPPPNHRHGQLVGAPLI